MKELTNQRDTGSKVIACLIVRMHSTRLPGKALIDVMGKPAIQWLVQRLQLAETVDDIVLCTSTHRDDVILLDKAREWGIKSYAGSEDDVLCRLIDVAKREHAVCVLRVTGDNILTDPEVIDWMVTCYFERNAEFVRVNGLPVGVAPQILSSTMLQPLHDMIADPGQTEYLTLFAFNPDRFKCLVLEAPPAVNRPEYFITLDTPDDLIFLQFIYEELYSGPGTPRLHEIVRLLDSQPRPREVNIDKLVKMPYGQKIRYRDLLEDIRKRTLKARKAMSIEGCNAYLHLTG